MTNPETPARDALMQAHTALAAQAGRDQAALARVRRLHDALAAETDLTSPDDEITRGAAAKKIAAALDGWSPPAAVSVPPPAPRADDQAALRDRIADALARLDAEKWGVEIPAKDHPFWQMYPTQADAVLAVLPEPADRAVVFREAANALAAVGLEDSLVSGPRAWAEAIETLRRMADEAQPVNELVDDYLRFLRGQGPEPDLSGLPPQQREVIAGQFEVVRALADRDPVLPPLDRDPVALRLGLYGDDHSCAESGCSGEPGPCVAGEQQNATPEAATVHAVPLPGSNGISSCCGRPPCEFVGERVTRDPDKVTCTGPTAGVRQDGAQT